MDTGIIIVGVLVLVALAFDFINGFHDAANSIATIVATRVLTPRWAVVWAGFFNFVAFTVFPLHVANAVGKGIIVDPSIPDNAVVMGALAGAIIWNLVTWWFGIPSSSSHALMGGLIGAGVAKGGTSVLGWHKITETAIFIVVSPVVGLLLGGLFMIIVGWAFRRQSPGRVDRWFRRLQFLSASLFSLGHGGNDAQKTMGIILALLIANGYLDQKATVPMWVVIMCSAAMGLGTLSGGWRIVKTMGLRLAKLKPFGGFCAETAGASMLFFASALGVPVSTTHTITGSIVGVGAVSKPGSVRWGIASRIVWAWVLTIPASAIIAALTFKAAEALGL